VRRLRWLVLFGLMSVLCCVIGLGIAQAQAVEIPQDDLPEGLRELDQFAPEGWTPGSPHPGQGQFEQFCQMCHSLGTNIVVGPGLEGLWQRIEEGPAPDVATPIQERILTYVLNPAGTADPYFLDLQQRVSGGQALMQPRGGMPDTVTERQILDIIDYVLRFRAIPFDESAYMRQVRVGRALVSGARPFANGAPACIGCHTAGADEDLRGANIASNIAGTMVKARNIVEQTRRGSADDYYADGLWEIMSGENAPRMHRYYRDGVGHLTDAEREAVMTFFNHQLRQVGTERESNYLPIFALFFAALLILVIEPGLYANLFVKEEHEYVDGPYQEDDHHGDDDGPGGDKGKSEGDKGK
jgi:hypothetical protein